MKFTHVLLVAALATGLYAKDAVNPVGAKVKAMVANQTKQINNIDAKKLHDMIKAEKDFLLIDIREPNEVAIGKIDNLEFKAIPAGLLPFKAKGLKTDKEIVIYCKAGSRGALATKLLKDLGFKNVTNLKGGIKGWLKAGYAIDTGLGELVIKK